jgi:2-isopropylmalate synthase
MGYEISDPAEIKILFARFKELADKKKNVTEEDIHALMVGKSIEDESVYELKRLQVQFVKDGIQGAIVGIQDKRNKDAKMQDSATGSGSIEAIYNTINRILDQEIILKEYNIEAITGGKDAQAEVHVVVEDEDGKSYNGTGIDFDVLTASAKAYIQASGKAKNKQTIEKVSAHF